MHLFFIAVVFLWGVSSTGGMKDGPKIVWVAADKLDPNTMEPAGSNSSDANLAPVFIARGPVDKKGYIPGFILPDKGVSAKLATGHGYGVETAPEHTKVLSIPKGVTTWLPLNMDEGLAEEIPKNVILGGSFPRTRENIYICRAQFGEKLLPGFFMPSKKGCVIWDGTVEKEFSDFELLIVNEYGIVTDAFS